MIRERSYNGLPDLPVLLLAHQPKQITDAVTHGVDLQISGHTHGGQIWPFHYLVRLDQPVVRGLSRHGRRTQLYTSRGAGFWGPPVRVGAPPQVSVVELRSAS